MPVKIEIVCEKEVKLVQRATAANFYSFQIHIVRDVIEREQCEEKNSKWIKFLSGENGKHKLKISPEVNSINNYMSLST